MTAPQSRHISVVILRPVDEVYAYAANTANLPQWAAGVGAEVELVEGQWFADSPMGRIVIGFAGPNPYGILDHDITLESGVVVFNPMRVVPYDDGAEVIFTLRRRFDMSDADFERDAAAVAADLNSLKVVLEAG